MAHRVLVIGCLLALCGVSAADTPVDRAIARLGDPAKRDAAHAQLVRMGTPALANLRGAATVTEDAGLRTRIHAIIKEIEKAEPHGLKFAVHTPKMKLTLDQVNRSDFELSVSVHNRGKEPVILWPYFSLRILDANGNPVPHTGRRGRWGRRRGGGYLSEVPFVTLQPGKRQSFRVNLAQYMLDPEWTLGWKLQKPGEYAFEFTYRYDRKAAKKKCTPEWKHLHDPDKPWNRALEMVHTFTHTRKIER